VIEGWLRLYNRLADFSFAVEYWPDEDSSRKHVDALCRDDSGRTLAIEHTLIEPFDGEKPDSVRFLKTLAVLDNHPDLVQPGYMFTVSQSVNSIPTGTNWERIPKALLEQLRTILPTLQEPGGKVFIRAAGLSLELQIGKMQMSPDDPGKLFTSRIHPGDPGPELIIRALRKKAEKLSASSGDTKILLLEKDSIAGTIERQFGQLPDDPEIKALLAGIDQIWSVDTVALESDNVIFTNQVMPSVEENRNCCSLDLQTDKFWRVPR
jgi:hypothetical protein